MTTFTLNILIITVICLFVFAIGMIVVELIKTAQFRRELKTERGQMR